MSAERPTHLGWGDVTAALMVSAFLAMAGGYALGATRPPCVPGDQRSCYTASPESRQGVQYCRRNGFGWERCQEFRAPYPQALWRSE